MIHIAICDDEEYFRLQEEKLVGEYMEKRKYSYAIDTYPSGKEMLDRADVSLQYDIVFLDINMEEMDGLETAQHIRKISSKVFIVFVTAFITYALEGYKVNAVRYLLKENHSLEHSVKECLDTIMAQMDSEKRNYEIYFPNNKKSISVNALLYVESRLHKVLFFIMGEEAEEYYKYDKLDCVEQELKPYGFFRIHQSFLVNIRYVKNVERYTAFLENGIRLNISKKYYKDIEKAYIIQRGEL